MHVRVWVDIRLAPVTAIEIGMGQQHTTLPSKRASAFFSWWLRSRDENRELHPPVRKAWKWIHSTLGLARCRLEACTWPHVRRCNSVWTWAGPHDEADKWKSPAGDWWEYTGGPFTHILDEIHLCTENMEWTKASTHLDDTGLEHGVDVCGFHKTTRLAREDRFAW